MASDSARTGPGTIDQIGESNNKIFTKMAGNEECLIGGAGNGRMVQLVELNLELPSIPDGQGPGVIIRWLVNDVLKAARGVFESHGILRVKDGLADIPGQFLFAVRNRIFEIGPQLYVNEMAEPFGAIGSGWAEALGVCFALEELEVAVEPERKLRTALAAAARYRSDVRGPFRFIHS